ncbi:hypothetical protein CLV92_11478 [Kineococcus xinjiangensis]|uniref:Uncharacterized protein n=1 Tax=Kineococcus xinjiangensis TaxID=512762 RepID=A0A2S6IE53_9ACTN|nr:hypothetical protein [Kineococcus xinjiangensis]PPK92477.1 hypothetical protein CLV92_11478 [Kineococcus xinjiangensis]
MGTRRWWGRPTGGSSAEADLRHEIERLTQENMRLRLERQRPHSLSSITEQLRAAVEEPAGATDALEARDEAHHVLAQAEVTRRAVLDVLDSLVVAASQMQRQLAQDVPLAEIDRRVTERRTGRGAGQERERLGSSVAAEASRS